MKFDAKRLLLIYTILLLILIISSFFIYKKTTNKLSLPAQTKTNIVAQQPSPTKVLNIKKQLESKSDLSYLTIIINPNVQILVTNSQGKKTGRYIHDGNIQTYNEILDATYGSEGAISNPDSEGKLEALGTGVNVFSLPKLSTGNYTITLSSNKNNIYTLNINTYTQDGESNNNKSVGTISPNKDISFTLTYDKHSLANTILHSL